MHQTCASHLNFEESRHIGGTRTSVCCALLSCRDHRSIQSPLIFLKWALAVPHPSLQSFPPLLAGSHVPSVHTESLAEAPCMKCRKADDKRGSDPMLVCDRPGCYRVTHLRCMDPPLAQVPDDDWFCSPHCTRAGVCLSQSRYARAMGFWMFTWASDNMCRHELKF